MLLSQSTAVVMAVATEALMIIMTKIIIMTIRKMNQMCYIQRKKYIWRDVAF
jgi:hypothetical protein